MEVLDERVGTEEELMSMDELAIQDLGGVTEDGRPVSMAPVPLWETSTGERRMIHPWYVPTALRKRHKRQDRPDLIGKPVFSRYPVAAPKREGHKCLLHPDRPERALYDSWGLAYCMSAHMPSEYELIMHMQRCHQNEYKAIERHREETTRREEAEARRIQTEALLALAAGSRPSAPVQATAPTVNVETAGVATTEMATRFVAKEQLSCPDCDYVTPADSRNPTNSLRFHRRGKHGGD
jgi:hypothetical protein